MAQRGTAVSINLADLERLAGMQCTDEEIAAWFGVSTRTIERRRKSRVFADTIERGKAKGRISLRRVQLKMLERGSATMGVWLGKQYLNQTDDLNINGIVQLVVAAPGSNIPGEMRSSKGTLDVDILDASTIDISSEDSLTDYRK
jgi:hypothetical protein